MNFPREALKVAGVAYLLFSLNSAVAGESKSIESGWIEKAWENFKSPVTTNAKYPLLIGAGISTALLVLEDQTVDPIQNEVIWQKPLGPTSKIGDISGSGTPNAFYIIGMLGYGFMESDDEAKRNALGMLQATLYANVVTAGLKYSIREPRPDSSERDSFPSGHTAAAFAFASYVACRHSLGWGLAAYSLATFVGFSRINDNRHFLHDVTAGASIGISYGMGICLLEQKSEKNDLRTTFRWHTAPTDGGFIVGLKIRY